MKILIAFFLLALVGFTYSTPISPYSHYLNYLKNFYSGKSYHDKAVVLLENLASAQQGHVSETMSNEDDSNDDDIADLQAVFNVLAQVEMERAAVSGNSATAQFWGNLVGTLWNKAKRYYKTKYCNGNQEMRAMLQELIGEQDVGSDADAGDGDDKARVELQALFDALKKAEAKAMQDENAAKAEGWWKKLRKSIKKKAKEYLC